MNRFSVTHVDAEGVRRRLVIGAPTRTMAWECAERLYGDAWFMSCVRA
jgi:hypothetical protein